MTSKATAFRARSKTVQERLSVLSILVLITEIMLPNSTNAGTGGVTVTGTIGIGFGFNITSGFTGFGKILECKKEPDCN